MSQTEVQLIKNNAVVEDDILNDAVTRDKINVVSTSSAPGIEIKGDNGSQEGYLQLNCRVNSHGVKIQSPPHSASQSYKIILPDNQIAADKFLKVKSITGSGSTATGQLEFADAGGGATDGNALTQFSDVVYASQYTTTNTSFQDSGLTKSITPSATTSKVLVIVALSVLGWGNDDRRFETALYRGSVSDSNILAKGLGGEYKSGSGDSYSYGHQTYVYIDSPATTSSTVYRIGLRSVDGTDVRIFGGTGTTNRYSYIYVQEIKGS